MAAALVDFARAENATQLVLGASGRSQWEELVRGSVINRVIRLSGAIDVRVITQPSEEAQAPPARPRFTTGASALAPRRVAWGWLLAVAGVPALTLVLAQLRGQIGLPTVLLSFLALVVTTATVGGTLPALAAAVLAFLSANYYFTPPIYTWTIAEGENVVALLVFLGTALAMSRFVDAAARRAVEAAWAQRQARTLARLAGAMADEDPLPVLLEHLRTVFNVAGAAVLRRDGETWRTEAAAGDAPPLRPEEADVVEHLGSDVVLVLTGLHVSAQDRAVLNAFAAQLAAALEHGRFRVEAGRSRALADSNALRSALLQAVSHDLRTPLASIKASVTSLSQRDVEWSPEETADFVRTINEETDRLNALVGNLLDMSRIQVGVQAILSPVALEEIVPAALMSLGGRGQDVEVDVSETLRPVHADAALLERAVANVIDNAVRFAPSGQPVRVTAGRVDGRVDLRVIDRGRGIPLRDRELVFQPFQRLGDSGPGGVGLGLAVAHGFVTAMGGEMEIEDTPGGGATVVVRLPAAS